MEEMFGARFEEKMWGFLSRYSVSLNLHIFIRLGVFQALLLDF